MVVSWALAAPVNSTAPSCATLTFISMENSSTGLDGGWRNGSCRDQIVLAGGPAGDAAFDQRKDYVERDAEPGEHEQAGEHQRHVEIRRRSHHHVADAAVRCHGFRQYRP